MAELVWKSMYYENDPSFLEHEKLGDELPWKHKSKSTDKSNNSSEEILLYHDRFCQWKNINTGINMECRWQYSACML